MIYQWKNYSQLMRLGYRYVIFVSEYEESGITFHYDGAIFHLTTFHKSDNADMFEPGEF